MEEKFGKRGFNVFAVSNEDAGTIDAFIKKNGKMNYFVGSAPKAFDAPAYDIQAFPTIYMLDPEGRVESTGGIPSDDVIESKLKALDLPAPTVGKAVAKPVAKAAESYDKKEYGKAYAGARKVADDEKAGETDKADATFVVELCDKQAEHTRKKIAKLKDKREYIKLTALLEDTKVRFKDHALAAEADAMAKELKADKDVKKEIKALEGVEALRKQLDGAKSDQQKAGIKAQLQKFAKDNAGTRAAEIAEELAGS